MIRWSQTLIPTLREDPADAELISHKLMQRGGFIRKLSAGVYNWLPLGYRVLRKVEAIVRAEMEQAGACEVHLPVLTPEELWRESGRWSVYGKEMWRITDRHAHQYALGPTHEEVITDMVRRDVRSYKQLPLNLFQIQVKFRDEIRPRFGVMRSREFLMKDAYSFDKDEAGLDISFNAMFKAYERIFTRCGLNFAAVEADSGAIGGSASVEFMVLADSGEEALPTCPACGYAANVEKAEGVPKVAAPQAEARPKQRLETPNIRTVEELEKFLKKKDIEMAKTIIYAWENSDAELSLVAVMMRGDQEINEVKLRNALKASELRLATDAEIVEATGAPTGFAGPIDLKNIKAADKKMRLLADLTVKEQGNIVCGGNEKDVHYIDVNPGRDFTPDEYLDLRSVKLGDGCPRCGKPLDVRRGIEVGHVFKLGRKYSDAMKAAYLDESGVEKIMVMGCYGIGISRVVAAAVEQHHDADGIIWPQGLAPYDVLVSLVNFTDASALPLAEKAAADLEQAGFDVMLDDRDERAGVKFKDADLIGVPLRVIIGRDAKDSIVEIKKRGSREATKVDMKTQDLAAALKALAGK